MFSHYNGVQIFIYPISIFYWLGKESIVMALSNLLTHRLHYLPLSFWGVLLFFILFVMMKNYTIYFQTAHHHSKHLVSDFWDSIIKLHVMLFIVLIIVMVFFVLTSFMSYFYEIRLPLKQAIALFFRLFTILMIFFYYIAAMWLSPYRVRGYGDKRSQTLFWGWLSKNPGAALQYTIFLILLVFIAVRLYLLMISYFYDPLFVWLKHYLNFSIHLDLVPLTNIGSIFYNLFMLAVAFMLSNLLFYPIIHFFQVVAKRLHPIKLKPKV